MSAPNSKAAFFRQSSWMVIATFAGGLCMMMVHTVSSKMEPHEYATFVSLLRLMIVLGVPASALQTIFAREAARATTDGHEAQLRAATRALVIGTFVIGLVMAAAMVAAGGILSRLLKISNPAALYFTAFMSLTGLWVPIGRGLLQGKHQFAGLGWLQISDGFVRLALMTTVVVVLHGKAASAMFAVMTGQTVTLVIAAWLTRPIWATRTTAQFSWKPWFAEALPLTLGLGSVLAMSSLDMLFVQGLLSGTGQTSLYGAAMLTGFAIIQFIAPIALVMFARVAQNVARAERTDSLGMTLAATISFGIVAAIGATLLPELPLRLIYSHSREMWAAAPLVPWFAWALLPLTVANVLVQNLLARGRFQAVPWLILVPCIYAAALCFQAPALLDMKPFDAFLRVIQTLGGASLLLCGVAAWFGRPGPAVTDPGLDLAEARAVSDTASSQRE